MSADVYSDLTVRLALKKYPKMIPDTLKSIHWIRSYGDDFLSADVYSDLIIGLASKKYQKMTLIFPKSIHWFKRYSEINQFLYQLMCSVTSLMDWP